MEKRSKLSYLLLPALVLLLVGALPAAAAPQAPVQVTAVTEAVQAEEPLLQEEPTAEPGTEPSAEGGGTICVNAFHDENANGQKDDTEGYMAGVTMIVAGSADVIGQAISDGSETPTCFHPLQQGSYQVAQQLPGRLEMTTAGNVLVAATDGQTVHVVFGSRLRQDDAPLVSNPPADAPADNTDAASPTTQEPEQGGGFDPLALSGLAVILIGVVLLGVLLFFLLRR